MAMPIAVWGSVRSDTGNAGRVDLNLYPSNFAGSPPQAGDIAIVTMVCGSASPTVAPTVTVSPGWIEHYTADVLIFGSYSSVIKVLSKVLTQADVNAGTATVYTLSGEPYIIDNTAGYGVRGAAYASLGFAAQATQDGTKNIVFPSLASPVGSLVIRPSFPMAMDTANQPTTFPNVFPSGWTRFGLDDNNGIGDSFAAFWHPAPAPSETAQTAQASNLYIPNFGFTISLSDTAGPDVTAPTITSSASPSVKEGVALFHALTADESVTWTKVGGANAAAFTLTGNTLSLPAQTYPSGPFEVIVRATGAAGNWTEQTITVTVLAVPIRFMGAASGTTTATMPAHQAGDLILCWAYRDGSNTLPTLASAGWTSLNGVTGANTNSARLVGKIAASSSEAVGTFTSATSVIVAVYRPKAGYALSFGAVAATTGASTTVSYPALTLHTADGSSWVAGFSGHRSVNTTLETPPSGMVSRATVLDATDEVAVHDTNGGVAAWTAQSVSVGGTSSGWRSAVVEIKVTYTSTTSPRKAPRYSSWL